MKSPLRRGTLHSFLTLAGAAGFTKVLTLVTMLVVARDLGPLRLGQLAVAQVLIAYSTIFSDAGLTDLTTRDIVGEPRNLVVSVNTTTVVQLVFGVLVGGALVLLAFLAPLPAGSGRLVLGYSPAIVAFSLGFGFALQAMDEMRALAFMRCLVAITTAVGTVVLVSLTRDPLWVCVMAWAGVLVGNAYAAWRLRQRFGWGPHSVTVRQCTAMTRRGLPFLGNGLLAGFLWTVDTIAIVLFRSAHDLGVYNAAWQICIAALLAVTTLTDAAYPEMVRRWYVGGRALQEFVGRLVAVTARVSLAVTALVVMESRELVQVVLGERFQGSASILRIEIWLVPLGYFAAILNFVLMAGGAQGALLRRRMILAVLAVISCTLGAREYGIVAVAWALVLVALTDCVLLERVARRRGIASPTLDLISQGAYLVLPIGVLAAVNWLNLQPRLAIAIPGWAIALVAIEAFRDFPTPRALRFVRQGSVP